MRIQNSRIGGFGAGATDLGDVCGVCGEWVAAGMSVYGGAAVHNYCKLCGIGTAEGRTFCCGNCEARFKKSARAKWRNGKWQHGGRCVM